MFRARAEVESDGTDELFGASDNSQESATKPPAEAGRTTEKPTINPQQTGTFSLAEVLDKNKRRDNTGKTSENGCGTETAQTYSFADLAESVRVALKLPESFETGNHSEENYFIAGLRTDIFNHMQACAETNFAESGSTGLEILLCNTSLPFIAPSRVRLQLLE